MENNITADNTTHKVYFYYRIEKEAGLAKNNETGENEPVYCEITFDVASALTEELLREGQEYFRSVVANKLFTDIKYVKSITKEECAAATEK